jgi:hypothetical protein
MIYVHFVPDLAINDYFNSDMGCRRFAFQLIFFYIYESLLLLYIGLRCPRGSCRGGWGEFL